MQDLNARSIEAAVKIVEGTARSMGIEVVEKKTEPAGGSDAASEVAPREAAVKDEETSKDTKKGDTA